MRKVLLFALSALFLASCSKNGNNDNQEPVSPSDPAAVSKAISVWHASRLTGAPPAPTNNGNGPQLDVTSNGQSIKTISGRYAVIQPEVTTGNVKGYYVQVTGAQEYFKVDYSKPRTGGRGGSSFIRKTPKNNHLMGKIFGVDSTGNGTLDSAVVVTIPTNIQPGQFCISYCAYDSLGNVSNVITACVTVATFGGDASVSYLNGLWKHTAIYDGISWNPALTVDSIMGSYTCVNNQLLTYCPSGNCTFTDYLQSVWGSTKADFTFGTNGGLGFESSYINKYLDEVNSTCSNLVYDDYSSTDNLSGAWSYNSTTQKLTMIFDFDSWGIPDPQAMEFGLQKISNTQIHLIDSTTGGMYRLQK